MKKQQVISRFFAPKSASPSSSSSIGQSKTAVAPASLSTVEWPPRASKTFSNPPVEKRPIGEDRTVGSSSGNVYNRSKRALSNGESSRYDELAKLSNTEIEVVQLDEPDNHVEAASVAPDREEVKHKNDGQPVEVNFLSVKKRTRSNRAEKEGRGNKKLKRWTPLRTSQNESLPLNTERDLELNEMGEVDVSRETGIHASVAHTLSIEQELSRGIANPGGDGGGASRSRDELTFPAFDPARHKKFVEKLLARIDENGMRAECRSAKDLPQKDKLTPLEQQVVELKAKYEDVVLMVEVGYKYRFFGEDAEIAAKVLGIFAHYDHNFLTASIPTFRLHVHVRRLVEAGYKVGVVRQTETAAIKAHAGNKLGPFSRSLSALYTRATLEAAEDLGGGESEGGRINSYLMCVAERVELPTQSSKRTIATASHVSNEGEQSVKQGGKETEGARKGTYDTTIGVIAVETATGDVMFGEFKDTIMRSELEACLLTCSPAELLLATPLSSATEKLLMDFAGPASNIRVERMARDCFDSGGAVAEVLAFYGSKDSEKLSRKEANDAEEQKVDEGMEAVMGMPELAVQALALALKYLKKFGLERILRLGASFRPFAGNNEMNLSSNTLRQLEILQNSADGAEKGSLLWLVNHTHTAFGARLFRHWLAHPLRDRALISARLDAVTEIAESLGSAGCTQIEGSFPGSGTGGGSVGAASRGRTVGAHKHKQGLLAAVLASLKKVPDLERGITRIFHRTATAAEFVSVLHALIMTAKQLQQLCLDDENDSGLVNDSAKVDEFKRTGFQLLKRLFEAASSSVVSEHATRLLFCLNKEAAVAGDKHNLFVCADGKFSEVAKCRAAVKAAEERLESFLPPFRKLLRIPNLQYSSVSGATHLIEVPIAQRVPLNWIKVSSTQKVHRYHTPEVLEALESLAIARETLTVECNRAWDAFLAEFSDHYVDFRDAVQAIAALDCLYSLAIVSCNQGYTRPEFVEESESPQLMIEGGRHPVLESTLQDGFVPNDTFLHAKREHCQIITGPNMGGKSCYIRQVALIAIMAQVGSYVPAASAKLHVFDAIYTRMGASDSIQRGSSTFLEELSEASAILQKATCQSLVIMDELGRGTSTHDGAAIAYATLQHLLTETCSLTLFVTHYPKLVELKEKYPGKVGPYYVSYLAEESSPLLKERIGTCVDEEVAGRQNVAYDVNQKITFLYKLVRGVASRSFGLHVARLAQIPEVCVQRAAAMASKLEKDVASRVNREVAFCVKKQIMDSNRHAKEANLSEEYELAQENALKNTGNSLCTVNARSFNGSCPTTAGSWLDAMEDSVDLQLILESDARVREGNKVGEVHEISPLESRGDRLNIEHALKMSDIICTVSSALKLSSEEAFSVLKNVQEHMILLCN